MDLEQLSKNITIDTGASQEIADLCNKLLDVQKERTALEDKLKKKKEEELKLSEQDIPNLMQKTGVSLLKLTDGSSVEIKPYYSARIPTSRTEEAFGLSIWPITNLRTQIIMDYASKGTSTKQTPKNKQTRD